MKRMRFILLLLVVTLVLRTQAQTFSKLPEKQRIEKLIKIAKKVYHSSAMKKYYAEFGESGQVEVTSYTIKSEEAASKKIGSRKLGFLQYIVKIYSQPDQKRDYSFPIVNVYISDTAGKAWQVKMGNDNMLYRREDTKEAFK